LKSGESSTQIGDHAGKRLCKYFVTERAALQFEAEQKELLYAAQVALSTLTERKHKK